VATPGRAIADGADLIVVGRPIRDAGDPLEAARSIGREIEEARSGGSAERAG
jgi:orotidine-5'-phosphate decarboxylase